jgi:hypothetical protein
VKTTVSITGIDQINAILGAIAPREAKNLMRTVVLDIAKQLATDAKPYAPNDPSTPGNYSSAFKGKRERGTANMIEASTIVEKKKGSRSFIWRFHEYGTGPDHIEYAMFLKSLEKMRPNMDRVYMETFARKLVARLARERKRAGV